MVREILFFVFVVLVLGLLWTVDHEKISKRLKLGVTIVALILGGAAWTYEKEVGEREAATTNALNKFNRGETLKCGEISVNKSEFNYEFGTASFVAKREAKNVATKIVPIKNCLGER